MNRTSLKCLWPPEVLFRVGSEDELQQKWFVKKESCPISAVVPLKWWERAGRGRTGTLCTFCSVLL